MTPGGDAAAPLVVTLLLQEEAQARFDRLRAQHFPVRPLPGARRERASGGGEGVFRLAAHVTLFHALPGEQLAAVDADLAAAADRAPFDVAVTGVRMLGRGVAYDLAAPELTALRDGLAVGWAPWLTRQDAQRLRAHITVQNKVTPARARALHAELTAGFVPERVPARGLGLWRYLGGPWEPVAEHPFTG
ncbi:2'-5' RNA ligase family protein [Modestobacter sp. I12A-02628]|uniref:2'-5' RNA ligase family protein n=1 Tax=Goekera deserti TaxID=2497753 RepID=A0A7K3WC81_9ACTN|nr:2'-5' RNA ligase family protein [Goekera deserti]NDI48329.1 2'-5' RNA ligase family protein [Goekera deserti]NEL54078.1 2'-5' RNA ligase family protein [Goekera deserti]